MTLVKLWIVEENKRNGTRESYEVEPGLLSSAELSKLEGLVEKTHVLEHAEIHLGPMHGQRELIIEIETCNSSHEIHACDTDLNGESRELANFIKAIGHRKE